MNLIQNFREQTKIRFAPFQSIEEEKRFLKEGTPFYNKLLDIYFYLRIYIKIKNREKFFISLLTSAEINNEKSRRTVLAERNKKLEGSSISISDLQDFIIDDTSVRVKTGFVNGYGNTSVLIGYHDNEKIETITYILDVWIKEEKDVDFDTREIFVYELLLGGQSKPSISYSSERSLLRFKMLIPNVFSTLVFYLSYYSFNNNCPDHKGDMCISLVLDGNIVFECHELKNWDISKINAKLRVAVPDSLSDYVGCTFKETQKKSMQKIGGHRWSATLTRLLSTLPDTLWLLIFIVISGKKGGRDFWEEMEIQLEESIKVTQSELQSEIDMYRLFFGVHSDLTALNKEVQCLKRLIPNIFYTVLYDMHKCRLNWNCAKHAGDICFFLQREGEEVSAFHQMKTGKVLKLNEECEVAIPELLSEYVGFVFGKIRKRTYKKSEKAVGLPQ